MNPVAVSQELENDNKEIKIEKIEDWNINREDLQFSTGSGVFITKLENNKKEEAESIDIKVEDLHHIINIKDETSVLSEPQVDQDRRAQICKQSKYGMDKIKQRRGKKTTHNQMETIVSNLIKNKIMLSGKCHPSNPEAYDKKWEEMCIVLNREPGGARKTTKQWKTFVSEWKSRVRKKARTHRKNLIQTGGGGFMLRDLSKIENRLMGAIGWVTIVGNQELPEEIDTGIVQVKNIIAEEEDCHLLLDISNAGSNSMRRLRKRKRSYVSSKSQLQQSAELYSSSAERMSVAVNNFSASITLLASAINNLASSLNK